MCLLPSNDLAYLKTIDTFHQWYNLILLTNIIFSQKNMIIQNGLAFLTKYTISLIAYTRFHILVYAVNLCQQHKFQLTKQFAILATSHLWPYYVSNYQTCPEVYVSKKHCSLSYNLQHQQHFANRLFLLVIIRVGQMYI